MSKLKIDVRRPTVSDANEVAAISFRCCADYPEQVRVWTAGADGPQVGKGYWIAEISSDCAPSGHSVVGYGRFQRERSQTVGTSMYRLYLGVHPAYRREGIGSALYNQMTQELVALGADRMRARIRADQSTSIDFLKSRGFNEYERKTHFALNLAGLDSASFAATYRQSQERMASGGVSILNLGDYSKKETDWLSRLLTVYNTLGADVPDADPYQPITQDAFEHLIADPDLPHAGFLVAAAGTEVIGYSYLLVPHGKAEAIVAMTGILPGYRRRGVATALKVHGMQYALSAGVKTMVTSASAINDASVAVNERLGFRRTHTEVLLEKGRS